MAACVLCRRIPWLRCRPVFRKDFTQAQHVHVKQADKTDDHEGMQGALQHQESSALDRYRLHYNPSSYNQSVRNSAASWQHTDNDEDVQCVSTTVPSLQQQSNRYSVSCSRHLSSSKNTLLDLAFDKSPEQEISSVSLDHREHIEPDVIVDPRAFLKCRPAYASVALDPTQQPQPITWEDAVQLLNKVYVLKGSMTPSDVSNFFVELRGLLPDRVTLVRSIPYFNMLLRYSVEHLRLFTDSELLEVLQSFVWLGMPSAHTVLRVYEDELSRRAHRMTLQQLLFAADLWRLIGKHVPQFLSHLYDSVRPHLKHVEVLELVHLCYVIGESRKCPTGLIRPLEQLIIRHLPKLLPEEVGVVCLGLFKSQIPLSESSVNCIVDKAHSFVEEMSDFAVVNMMKYLRFSYVYHRSWMEAMDQEVPRRVHGMGVQGLMHVALACSALHSRRDDVLVAIGEKIPTLVRHCRIKDMSKLLWAFGTLQFLPEQCPKFYSSLIDALRQMKAEFGRYPQHLLTALQGLAFVSLYPEDLLEFALNPDFVNSALKSSHLDLRKDLLTLDGAVAMEFPHWTGPQLSSELREEVQEMLWKFAQSDVCLKPQVLEAESSLQELFGGEAFVQKRMILPYTRSIDLEVHLDSTGKPIPVNSEPHLPAPCPEKSSPEPPSNQGWGKSNVGVTLTDDLLSQLINTKKTPQPLTPPFHREEGEIFCKTGLKLTSEITEALIKPSSPGSSLQGSKGIVKLAIQIPSRNHYCYQSQQLLGLHVMKRRHLGLAGYKVVELNFREWFPLLRKSRTEKLAYLHCKVYNSMS